jgi:hypothetical protein
MKDFDVADANLTCTRRDRSNTPLQALTLLNDPVMMECAREFGLRLMTECSGTLADRVDLAFRLALARQPAMDEHTILRDVYQRHRELYQADPTLAATIFQASRLPADVDAVEAAAWTAVARTMLNLDEFITRE